MKRIDEAGVKWHLSHPDADKEEMWKAGANYVLEQIENSLQEFSNYEDSLIISRIIKQLKK